MAEDTKTRLSFNLTTSSGPVEKAVGITISARFKRRRMSWYERGINPLLELRLLKLNGEWEAHWNHRKHELTCHEN
ncbi:MAG: hypothetical protein ACPLPQ_10330 [Candidatus Saccharicenans sp.]